VAHDLAGLKPGSLLFFALLTRIGSTWSPHLAVVSKGWSRRLTLLTLQIQMEFWHPTGLY
jgi:hypothetical protein